MGQLSTDRYFLLRDGEKFYLNVQIWDEGANQASWEHRQNHIYRFSHDDGWTHQWMIPGGDVGYLFDDGEVLWASRWSPSVYQIKNPRMDGYDEGPGGASASEPDSGGGCCAGGYSNHFPFPR
jgi:hypothetical protein